MSDQYSVNSILRYESIFGDGFISPGGAPLMQEQCARIELGAAPRILDIGSGVGGAAFYFVEQHGATVEGIDLSREMVDLARARASQRGSIRTTFRAADVQQLQLERGSFDLIYSRGTLLHLHDKPQLFARFIDWLSPDGQLFITDYATGTTTPSSSFQQYVSESGYDLHPIDSYASMLKDAGFAEVHSEDWSERFSETLQAERTKLLDDRERFLADFSSSDLDYLLDRWEQKINWCAAGDMKAGIWHAHLAPRS